jgi:3-oxoacyl-[acyl-carrier protein] reductase
MTKKLSGKTAIVTGASQGIGLAVARRFFNDGANLVLTYLPEHGQAERIIEQIGGARDRVLVIAGDLRQIDFVGSLFKQAGRRFGTPQIVAAVAGVNLSRPVVDTTEEDYDRIFSLNVRATFWIFREAARRVSDGGRIIGVSSNMVLQGRTGHALYAGSKAAVEQFVRTLAKELGARGITVNAVAPGPTDTAMVSQLSRDTAPAITPLGRLGQPADIADLVGFLASEDARWITGQIIGVNGGIV